MRNVTRKLSRNYFERRRDHAHTHTRLHESRIIESKPLAPASHKTCLQVTCPATTCPAHARHMHARHMPCTRNTCTHVTCPAHATHARTSHSRTSHARHVYARMANRHSSNARNYPKARSLNLRRPIPPELRSSILHAFPCVFYKSASLKTSSTNSGCNWLFLDTPRKGSSTIPQTVVVRVVSVFTIRNNETGLGEYTE